MPVARINKEYPRSCDEIANKILHYGRWKAAFDYMVDHLNNPMSSSMILRGNSCVGKKSLIREACIECGIEPIYINPYHSPDDTSALRYLAKKLNVDMNSLLDLGNPDSNLSIKRKGRNQKVLIILLHFQEFCRQRQMLLYQLTTLTQHAKNFSFIGVTQDLDSMSGLEKRVRSRINTHSYNLLYPYTNRKEYIEFASLLVGGWKLEGNLLDQLNWMYSVGCYEISEVKRLMISVCSWSIDGDFEVCRFDKPIHNPKSDLVFMGQKLTMLTKIQLDTLKVAVHYSYRNNCTSFTFEDLFEHACKHDFSKFPRELELSVKNLEPLTKTFIDLNNPKDNLTPRTVYMLNIVPELFRYLMEQNPSLHSTRTDPLWKCLPAFPRHTGETVAKKQKKVELEFGIAI